ncbi:acyltransferase family protein [Ruegeria sp.]|uniref:acyltransferase family protein n=1 Tax=Ruegeria sp. TaxID=1879320 RepID=UPI003C79F483
MSYFITLQYLRAIAAGLVAVFHICLFLPDRSFYLGNYGVDIFFVISGFVMYLSGHKLAPQEFMVHRISRIVPLYWTATFAFIAMAGITSVSMEEVFKTLFFIAYADPETKPLVSPILTVGWTLNMEMFFYVLFAIGLALFRRWLVSGLVAIFIILIVVGRLVPDLGPVAEFYTKGILLEFAAGLVIAKGMADGWLKPGPIAGVLLCILSLVALALLQDVGWRMIRWGIPACLIVVGMLALEPVLTRIRLPVLETLGDASYALYLSHLMVIGPAILVLELVLAPDHWLMIVAVFVVCQAAAVGIYRFYERPVNLWLKSLRQRRVASG